MEQSNYSPRNAKLHLQTKVVSEAVEGGVLMVGCKLMPHAMDGNAACSF
jgi:hypothetical protein